MCKEIFLNVRSRNICCLINKLEMAEVPVLMLHGLGGCSNDFASAVTFKGLSDKTIIIPELLGFGKSEKPFEYSYDLTEQAELVNGIIENLGCKKVDLVAHSMGGVIAILFAKNFPHKVNKLIVAEPNLTPNNAKISVKIENYGSEEGFKENFKTFVEKYNKKESPAAMRFYETLKQCTYYSLYRSAVSILKYSKPPFYEEFLKLDAVRSFIRGEKSYHEIDNKMIKDFCENNIHFYTVPEAGHGMMGDNPEAFYNTLYRIIGE